MKAFTSKGMESDLNANISRLKTLCEGDNFKPENMLIAQAHTLDAMFNNLAHMATLNLNNLNTCSALLNLALRSQNQCGKALATLGELKNPKRATFIKQLNQANQMQVNNSENLPHSANELLTDGTNENLDTRTTIEASGVNQNVATVAKINGRKNKSR